MQTETTPQPCLEAADVEAFGLTAAEREAFDRDGYFIVPGALDDHMLERLSSTADTYLDRFRSRGGKVHDVLNLHDLVGRDPVFTEMVTWPRTFHKVWQILGWNIQLFHTQLMVTPTSSPESTPGPTGFHQAATATAGCGRSRACASPRARRSPTSTRSCASSSATARRRTATSCPSTMTCRSAAGSPSTSAPRPSPTEPGDAPAASPSSTSCSGPTPTTTPERGTCRASPTTRRRRRGTRSAISLAYEKWEERFDQPIEQLRKEFSISPA